MKKPERETQQLEQLLGKYRFTRPVPASVRADILASRERNFVRVLKAAGSFSAVYGVFASLYFAVKKGGTGVALAKILLAGLAVVSVSAGGYFAARAVMERLSPGDARRGPVTEGTAGAWVDEIMLFDGRVIRGAIVSRGETYRVRTDRGIMHIPRSQVRAVKPLAEEGPVRR